MADTAEVVRTTYVQHEAYGRSHSKLRLIGSAAIGKQVRLEQLPAYEQARTDFASAVTEMLVTDPELYRYVDIDHERDHAVVDGQARDVDGRTMVEIVKGGHRASSDQASRDSRFESQAIRDAGDVLTAKAVDELRDGESYFAVSMYPKEALEDHPELYRDELGYRKNLIYIQRYTKSAHELKTGSHSIYMENEAALRDVLAEEGVAIPAGESADNWITHGFKREFTASQAEQFVQKLRGRYYKQAGINHVRYSVSEYVGNNSAIINGYFNTYYPDLSRAIQSKENNQTMRDLANVLLQKDLSNMKSNIRSQLMRVANATKFDDDLGKTMDSLLRYAAAEDLRVGLRKIVKGVSPASGKHNLAQIGRGTNIPANLEPAFFNQRIANNVEVGIKARRSYGGCAGQVELAEDGGLGKGGFSNGKLQQAIGGRGRRESWKTKKGKCVVQTCPTRPGEVEIGPCGVCMRRCQVLYDAGKDPTKMGTVQKAVGSKTTKKEVRYSYN